MGESDSDQNPYVPPEAGLEGEGSEVDLYRAFIGGTEAQAARTEKESDVERYLERFHRRDEVGGLRPGWHWPAFLVTAPWLVYRRMYLELVLYFVSPFVIAAIGGILFPGLTETELSLQALPPLGFFIFMGSFGILYVFLPPMFADTVYWWHTKHMIRRAQKQLAEPHEQIAWLRKKGGTASVWLVVLVLVIEVVAYAIS